MSSQSRPTIPLVNYYSDSDADSDADSDRRTNPPPKRRKPDTAGSPATGGPATVRQNSPPPPLPSAFYDLYAGSVRTSTVDDPSLHHGRTRGTPHRSGHWPSHVYVEWYPTPAEHAALTGLVQSLRPQQASELHSLLVSDTATPQPLHVSLSRPLSLSTENKAAFLATLSDCLCASGVKPFAIVPQSLAWYHSPDSHRAFLILRVACAARNAARARPPVGSSELSRLLDRCNATVREFGQPPLYSHGQEDGTRAQVTSDAFHVSVAWRLGRDVGEFPGLREADETLTRHWQESGCASWEIGVDTVKVKIGNVVTSVPLTDAWRSLENGRVGARTLYGV